MGSTRKRRKAERKTVKPKRRREVRVHLVIEAIGGESG